MSGKKAKQIEESILTVRNHRVILDRDLAAIYGVTPKRLKEQVKRNRKRFPQDFMLCLTLEEAKAVFHSRSQFATLKRGQNIKYRPYAFTEYGALMAANILNSARALTMSIFIIRAFVRLREVFVVNQILADRLADIEEVLMNHGGAIEDLYRKIKLLLLPPKRVDAVGFEIRSPRPGKIG